MTNRKCIILSFLVLILGFVFFGGFLIFNRVVFSYAKQSNNIQTQYKTNSQKANINTTPHQLIFKNDEKTGIAALTGGRNRIEKAIELLNQGIGERMLISGVKPGTEIKTIISRQNININQNKPLDLGYLATDTVSNAKEVRDWAKRYGMETIYIVTSFYHIPRSRLELEKEIPQKDLHYIAAISPYISSKWWEKWHSLYFMIREYAKFLIVYFQYKMIGL